MKYTLQKCFAFLMIIFIFGLYSCEKDLYEENIQNSSRKIIMRNFSIKELNNKSSKLFNTITNIKKSIEKNNLDGRLVYDSINNFYFDDEKGIYLDDGISKSYVFKVERSNGNDKIEKLVFSLKQNGDYKILLAKYDFNANELEVLTKQQLEQKEVKFEDITNPINRVALMTCVMNYSCVDNGELHGADSPATCAWVLTSFDCSLGSTAGGGGGGESGSGSGGINAGHYGTYSGDNGPGGSGNGGSGGNGTYISPIATLSTPMSNNDNYETPCTNLKKHLSATTGLKLKSSSMIPALQIKTSERAEKGNSFRKNSNGVYYSPELPSGTSLSIVSDYGGNIFGSIHTHVKVLGVPMFSFSDVYSLSLFYENASDANKPEAVVMIVCYEAGDYHTYALKIDDITTFNNALQADISASITSSDLEGIPTEQILNKKLELMDKIISKFYTDDISNLQKSFLNRFSGFGISLYEVNANSTNWNQLSLQSSPISTNPVQSNPCNH